MTDTLRTALYSIPADDRDTWVRMGTGMTIALCAIAAADMVAMVWTKSRRPTETQGTGPLRRGCDGLQARGRNQISV